MAIIVDLFHSSLWPVVHKIVSEIILNENDCLDDGL